VAIGLIAVKDGQIGLQDEEPLFDLAASSDMGSIHHWNTVISVSGSTVTMHFRDEWETVCKSRDFKMPIVECMGFKVLLADGRLMSLCDLRYGPYESSKELIRDDCMVMRRPRKRAV
jgi:hypothetical protein